MSLKNTFNSVAQHYEQSRPEYPQQLAVDTIALSGIPAGGRILEIGCATGKATRMFAKRGYLMTCLDIGENLICIAQKNFQTYPNVNFEVTSFEEWNTTDSYDMVMAATSWHWIHPAIRYPKAASLLHPGGSLALMTNIHVHQDVGFFAETQEIYATCAPKLAQKSPVPPLACWEVENAQDHFSEEIRRIYPWSQSYSTQEYIRLLNTYSNHIILPETQKEPLFDGIARLIDTRYNGCITKDYEAVLSVFIRV